MKKMLCTVTIGLGLSGLAGVGLSAGLAPAAGAATPPSVATAQVSVSTGHHRARAWWREHRRAVARVTVQISAKTIGISPTALVGALHSGQSIAEVASSHNVAVQSVVHALVQAGDAAVGRAVGDHRLTQTQGTKIESALPSVLLRLVHHHTFGQYRAG